LFAIGIFYSVIFSRKNASSSAANVRMGDNPDLLQIVDTGNALGHLLGALYKSDEPTSKRA
jgi:hypothetical protein